MSKKPPPGVQMTKMQIVGGIVFLPFYLVILQLLIALIYMLAVGSDVDLHDTGLLMLISYYAYFFITVIIFRKYLAGSLMVFGRNFMGCLKHFIAGYALIYIANIVISLIMQNIGPDIGNLNNEAVFSQLRASRGAVIVSTVFLAPVVEESIFRGLLFDNLRRRSRLLGYIVSCLAFALLHLWAPAFIEGDLSQLILIIEYLPAGFFLAWSFEKSGSIWTPIILHAAINAMSVALASLIS